MNHPSYDKKHWLSQHIKAIDVLEQQGCTQHQIIEQLKTEYGMPFALDKSLYSRHIKKIKAEQQRENQEQKDLADYQELKKYCDYLEQSNRQLLEQQRIHRQEKYKLKTALKEHQKDQGQQKTKDSEQIRLNASLIKNDDSTLKLKIKRLEDDLIKEASQHQKIQETLLKTQKESKYYGFFAILFSITTLFFMILLILKT